MSWEAEALKKKVIIFLLMCAVAKIGFETLSETLYLNVSESLQLGLYLRMPKENYQRGDYIIYEPPEEVKAIIIKNGWGNGNRTFLKKVGAIAGDSYSIDEETLIFEAAGKYIGQVYETDTAGNKLPKLRGKFKVKEGNVLPVATNARSFDGRYTGEIPTKSIKTRVIPILTW